MRHRLDPRAGELRLHRRPAARRPPLHRSPAHSASPPRCSTTSTARRSISSTTTTASTANRWSCRAKFPNLLVNGSDGIAVGMATDIPPHNLREVCQGLDHAHRRPRDLARTNSIEIIPGPDFPTGGMIMGRQGIIDGYSHRPRQDHAPGPGRDRSRREGQVAEHHHHAKCRSRSRANRLCRGDRRAGQGRAHQGHQRHPRRIERPQRRAGRVWSSN